MEHYQGRYAGAHLNHVAFPLGGIGAGMLSLEGAGGLSQVSLRHRPQVFHEPVLFAAVSVNGADGMARVLEGPVPARKVFGGPGTGRGGFGKHHGLPRLARARFEARFPFATVELEDDALPLAVTVTGWSPFVPGDADASSLPVAALEYRLTNVTDEPAEAVFSFHAENFMATDTPGAPGAAVRSVDGGFCLDQPGSETAPWDEGAFVAFVSGLDVNVDCAWFRGGWFDALTMLWNTIASGAAPARPAHSDGAHGGGASVYHRLQLSPGETQVVPVLLAWYVPRSDQRFDWDSAEAAPGYYQPWYGARFESIDAVAVYWREQYETLREHSATFGDCFYDTTLPAEVVGAVAANLSILKSPTVLRQADGRLWCWEGCNDDAGCCPGSCTHVWNYAQALPHLFADLERGLRQTEFHDSQDERGHQTFRAALPIGPVPHSFHAAADGQLGGVMQVYREWRISGDTAWLAELWPRVRQSLDYCIATWDPDHKGLVEQPHHNTFDIEFWGPDGMCTSIYLGALVAACAMGAALGDDTAEYRRLYARGRTYLESELFNGEYFVQQVQWEELTSTDPAELAAKKLDGAFSLDALRLMKDEGPKYQYGTGCLSDGVLGAFLAWAGGLGDILDPDKVRSHVAAVHRHNFRTDLSAHANPQRPGYALGSEGGLLLCSWPRGGKPSLPFVYSDEVWTSIEYHVAAYLMRFGMIEQGLQIVRTCRDRYDGRVRNPFDEYECGHWYARALSSYAMLQGLTGLRYDAVDKVLYLAPSIPGDFRAFLSTATGFGTVGIRGGQPFVEVRYGRIDVDRIDWGGEARGGEARRHVGT